MRYPCFLKKLIILTMTLSCMAFSTLSLTKPYSNIQNKATNHKPFWKLGKLTRGMMVLKNGNLECPPYDCSVTLKENEYFSPVKNISHVYALMHKEKKKIKIKQYFFYTNDIVNIPAYSGYPIACELSIDPHGNIVFTRLVAMNEPIFIEGIPIEKLTHALSEYSGKNVADNIIISRSNHNKKTIDLITGATVTSLILNQTILDSARKVAQQLGIIKRLTIKKIVLKQTVKKKTWQQLIKMKAIRQLKIMPEQMGLANNHKPWLDLYFADLTSPTIGENLLGAANYKAIMGQIKPGRSVIIILNNASWSFKGSAFVRGGIFDRFNITQGLITFTFRDIDYQPLYLLPIQGAPNYQESGIFVIANDQFRIEKPWTLNILASRLTYITAASKMYKTFKANYVLPKNLYTIKKPAYEHLKHKETAIIKMIWESHFYAIIWYIILWLLVIYIFIFRKRISSNYKRLEVFHLLILIAAWITIGLYQAGQPSVINVITFFDTTLKHLSFSLFFKDPYLAIGWIMITLTIMIWGRSLFCGWLCPFGAIQEVLFKLRVWLTPFKKNYDFSIKINAKLRYLRYILFAVIFFISFYSFELAETVIDKIEPFKSVWNVGLLKRPIGYGIFVFLILLLGLFSYRFYCRYICPLGGGLSIISAFPLIRIRRRNTCTTCKLCSKECEPKAIDTRGKIDSKECLGCLSCINKSYDKTFCPPLRNKKLWIKNHERDI